MPNKYNKFCPLEQRTENVERIKNAIAEGMENGNDLKFLFIPFIRKFIRNYYAVNEIYSQCIFNIITTKGEAYDYIIEDSEPIVKNKRFLSWSFAVTKNLAYDYLKYHRLHSKESNFSTLKKNRNGLISMAEERTDNIEESFIDEDALSPIQELIKQEDDEKLLQAISQLPKKKQDLINMRYFEGEWPRDIADKLKIPIVKVKSDLYLARKKLREKLAKVL